MELFIALIASAYSSSTEAPAATNPWFLMLGTFVLGIIGTLIWQPRVTPAFCATFRATMDKTLTEHSERLNRHEDRLACTEKNLHTLEGNIMPLLRIIEERTGTIAEIRQTNAAMALSLQHLATQSAVIQAKQESLDQRLKLLESNG